MALGAAQAPPQIGSVGPAEILPDSGSPTLGVCDPNPRVCWSTDYSGADLSVGHSDCPARQNQIGRQPIRSGLGLLLRAASSYAHAGAAARTRLPKTTLAAATRPMPGMRSTHRRR